MKEKLSESETLNTVKPPAGVSIPVVTVPEFLNRLADANALVSLVNQLAGHLRVAREELHAAWFLLLSIQPDRAPDLSTGLSGELFQ